MTLFQQFSGEENEMTLTLYCQWSNDTNKNMSKDSKTVTSFDLCPDLGLDSYISPSLKEQHSEFANQCTGRQRIEATWPKWKGHLSVNACSTCQVLWSMVIFKFLHPWNVWKSAVTVSGKVGETCCFFDLFFLQISTLLTAGWFYIVKPCERNLQSANDHRLHIDCIVWCSCSFFCENWQVHFKFLSQSVLFLRSGSALRSSTPENPGPQEMLWIAMAICPARRLVDNIR